MSKIELKFKIEADNDGYISFECPFCKSIFGLNVEEYQSNEESINEIYCPYCGLVDNQDQFYTKEVLEQIDTIMMNYVNDEINKAFGKMAKSLNSKYIKTTYKPLKNKKINSLKTKESSDEIFECNNCKHHVKVDSFIGKSKIYCSYCGLDIC